MATAWPQVDDVNRLTREKPELFEIEQFDKHLRSCLLGKDFDSWVDLSETCGLAMADSRMTMLREIVTSNPREKVTKSKPAAPERPGGQAADAVRAELEGAMERAASPGASDRASSIGSEEGEGKSVYVCPVCTVPMGNRRSLQAHLPTCIKGPSRHCHGSWTICRSTRLRDLWEIATSIMFICQLTLSKSWCSMHSMATCRSPWSRCGGRH